MRFHALLPPLGLLLLQVDPVDYIARGAEKEHSGYVHVDKFLEAAGLPEVDRVVSHLDLEAGGHRIDELLLKGDSRFQSSLLR